MLTIHQRPFSPEDRSEAAHWEGDLIVGKHQLSAMGRHLTIIESLGTPVYFCDSRSPWQGGTNENANGLLRDYFPKGTDLGSHSPAHLLAAESELNNRPRLVLKAHSRAKLFTALLASNGPPALRR